MLCGILLQGKDGATRKKLELASGAILQYVGHVVPRLRKRGERESEREHKYRERERARAVKYNGMLSQPLLPFFPTFFLCLQIYFLRSCRPSSLERSKSAEDVGSSSLAALV